MTWRYKEFLHEVDVSVAEIGNKKLSDLWSVTKADVSAFAEMIAKEEEVSANGMYYLVWSRWEDLFSGEEEVMDWEAALIMNVVEFKQGCPDHLWPVLHYAVEVGFARARGFTREEARTQQNEFITKHGGWEAFYHPQNEGLGFLTVIEGGKNG